VRRTWAAPIRAAPIRLGMGGPVLVRGVGGARIRRFPGVWWATVEPCLVGVLGAGCRAGFPGVASDVVGLATRADLPMGAGGVESGLLVRRRWRVALGVELALLGSRVGRG
jgi:hypothetical protein